jgi:hypothetical protein
MDLVVLRYPDAVPSGPPLSLHGSLDPTLKMDRPETSPEEPGSRALEDPLEEALEAREWSHRRAGV